AAGQSSRSRSAASPGASRSMIEASNRARRLRSCAPLPLQGKTERKCRAFKVRTLVPLILLALLLASPLVSAQNAPRQTLTIGYGEIAGDPRYEPIRGADRIVLKTRAHPFAGAQVSIDDAAPLHRVLPVDFALARVSVASAEEVAPAVLQAIERRDI